MKSKSTIQVWEHDRVRKVLPALPRPSREAYDDFVCKFSQGYYLLGGDPVADLPGGLSNLLSTGDRVIYRVVESGVVDRLEVHDFKLKHLNIRARFISTLDNVSRVMTLQQILSMLASSLGTKLF